MADSAQSKPPRSGTTQLPSQLAGRYSILAKLGAGGMGVVYHARDDLSGREVALKQLHVSADGKRRSLVEAMFEREYQTLVRLKHPRVIEVYDYGVSESGPYYTMELLDGQDLQQLAPLPYRDACSHLRDVASLLALLSAHRLVHRDVSPRNVRLTRQGRAKLIDFGALHAFGPPTDIVGTPPCMAPEVLSMIPLDHRTDVYALGALSYWALTGRHAFPARRLDDLPGLWQTPPAPPSKFVPDIPPALDALVLSLLSIDPISRPASLAAVIDELTAIGQLSAEEHEHTAESYLLSGRMVGRDDEQTWFRQRITRALRGQGIEAIIEGPSGIGKTRLMNELALEAQLKGIAVLKADAQALPRPFDVAIALSRQLIMVSPEEALRCSAPHGAILGHLSSELHGKLGKPALRPLPQVPAEQRALLQGALHGWFIAFARKRPVLLAVDNLQAIDENSAAFLAALGLEAQQNQMILLCTQRSGEAVRAKGPVRTLRKRSAILRLAGLRGSACVELCRSLFGDVANTGRLAHLLHERSGGNPQQCMDLTELLVRKKIAKYVAGTWVLPLEVATEELPRGLEALSDARLLELSDDARRVLQELCIHDRPVSLELCLHLAGGEALTTHAALDELVREQVLIVDRDSYRFARESLRQALLERMDEATRRDRHRRVAEWLLERGSGNLVLEIRAAKHLLNAGDETRGAELLAPLGRRFLNSNSREESPEEVVSALLAALRVFEAQRRPPHAVAELLFPMIGLAYYTSQWQLIVERGEQTVAVGAQVLGLERAGRLRRFLGRKLALMVATLWSAILFLTQPKRNRGWNLVEAMLQYFNAVPAIAGTLVACHDGAMIERIEQKLVPLTWLGENQPINFIYTLVREMRNMALGELTEPRVAFARDKVLIQRPGIRKVLGETHARFIYGGMLCSHALLSAYRFGDEALTSAKEAEALGINMWALGAAQARMLYHALRGETDEVSAYRAKVELLAVQGGTTWQLELAMPTSMMCADLLTGDTIAVRRTFEQLARRAQTLPALEPYAEAAQAAYLMLRGQLTEAIAIYEKVIPRFNAKRRAYWLLHHAAFAQALNRTGQHVRAKQLLETALLHTSATDREFVGLCLEAERQLALAEAGLQHHDRAGKLLDAMLEQHAQHDNPLLIGLLHKARAEVALQQNDADGFNRHFAELERRFRGTKNPALIAQTERLLSRGVQAGLCRAPQTLESGFGPREVGSSIYRSLMDVDGASDPFEHTLRLIVQRTRAKGGFLYLYENNLMRIVAANLPDEAPRGLETLLQQQAERVHFEAHDDFSSAVRSDAQSVSHARPPQLSSMRSLATNVRSLMPSPEERTQPELGQDEPTTAPEQQAEERTLIVEAVADDVQRDSHRVALLRVRRNGRSIVVGGLILEIDPDNDLHLPPALLEATADAIYLRGTAVTR